MFVTEKAAGQSDLRELLVRHGLSHDLSAKRLGVRRLEPPLLWEMEMNTEPHSVCPFLAFSHKSGGETTQSKALRAGGCRATRPSYR
jgi:hypothetical protein